MEHQYDFFTLSNVPMVFQRPNNTYSEIVPTYLEQWSNGQLLDNKVITVPFMALIGSLLFSTEDT